MATTYKLISSSTVGSGGATSVSLSSIPGTYTDLLVKVSARIDNANGGMFVKLNNTSSNYVSYRINVDSGSLQGGTGSTSSFFMWATGTWATASAFNNSEMYISNYTSSNHKSVIIDSVNENNASSIYAAGFIAGKWTNSSVVTSIDFTPEGAGSPKFDQYSTFYVYGIKNS